MDSTPLENLTKLPDLKDLIKMTDENRTSREQIKDKNKLDPREAKRMQLKKDTYKVRNLMGANPFKVKNYV